MTTYSLRIREMPEDASEQDLESSALKAPIVQSLASYAEACGPYRLSDWAEARGHPRHYVDNCWVRAEVGRQDVVDFLSEVLAGEPTIDPRIIAGGTYLIEAEEY